MHNETNNKDTYMRLVNWIIITGCLLAFIVIVFLTTCVYGLRERMMNLQNQVDSLCNYVELEECFGCDSNINVRLIREGDIYHVECENCAIRSGFYKESAEAIETWNDLNKD